MAGLAGGIVLALLLGTVVASFFARTGQPECDHGTGELVLANRETDRADKAARNAEKEAARADLEAEHVREEKHLSDRRLYVAEINLADQAYSESNMKLVRQHLDTQRPKRPGDPDLRGFHWYLSRSSPRRRRSHPTRPEKGVLRVRFSPDGRTLASANAGRWYRGALGRRHRKGTAGPARTPALSATWRIVRMGEPSPRPARTRP